MMHIRVDSNDLNSQRRFACGLGPSLPSGDKWVYETEIGLHSMVDCPACSPQKAAFGRPASSMDGNAANRRANPDGWSRWVAFCDANGLP